MTSSAPAALPAAAMVAGDADTAHPPAVSTKTCKSGRTISEADLSELRSEHAEGFASHAKMGPVACYRPMIASMMLRLAGEVWISMAWLEYVRFYILNDITMLGWLVTCIDSPQCLAQAFLFPFIGVFADRVSRKKVLVAAAWCAFLASALMCLVPSVEVLIVTKVLNLVAEIGTPIREAMMRDVFCRADWEYVAGGSTGIKARIGVPTSLAAAGAVLVGIALLKGGEMGVGLPNEYSLHKAECAHHVYCVPRGHYTWSGHGWKVEGVLRLLMVMGSLAVLLDAMLIMFFFPETRRADECRPAQNAEKAKEDPGTQRRMFRELGGPWNNLRVLATEQLRSLMSIQVVGYIVAAGGSSIFLSLYRRLLFDSFQMTVLAMSAGPPGFLAMLAVPRIVDRFGDLRGLWLPSRALSVVITLLCALVTSSSQLVLFIMWPLLSGPAGTLGSFSTDLLSKLIPAEVQGTYQTGKSFLYRLTKGVFVWPWLLLLEYSADAPYPLDTLPVWVSLGLGLLSLAMTVLRLRRDPRDTIWAGDALDEFWESGYAKGSWYQIHSGRPLEPETVIVEDKIVDV